MILLTYLNNNKSATDNYLDISSFICSKLKNDLILFSDLDSLNIVRTRYKYSHINEEIDHQLLMLDEDHSSCYKNKPVEDLVQRKIDNIILVDFDNIDLSYIENLIRLKSKTSNIIGVNVAYNDTFKDFQLFEQELRDLNMTDEEIIVGLSLKFNSSTFVNQYRDIIDIISHRKETKIKEIESINCIEQYIKR